MSSSTIALIILVVTLVLFVSGVIPLSVTAILSATAMGVFGCTTFARAFSGFSNDVTVMIMGSIIVGEALFLTGAAQLIGTTIIKMVGTNEKVFMVACILVSAVLSALLSNTAVVAMMIPVVAATAATSKGAVTKKNTLMAIGFAANLGGGMTLVGSTPNVIGQGLLAEAGEETMGFFDLTLGSVPRLLFMVIFYVTIGYTLQKKFFNFEEVASNLPEKSEEDKEAPRDTKKMLISIIIMVLMVVGFVTELWTVGTVAMVAALACIITGCISIKQVFERMDWQTIWVIAGSFGFANGVSDSGAGKLIADKIIGLLGGNITMMSLLLVFTILATILGNLMSSSATTAMLGPIAISMCQSLGFSAKPILMVIIWALNLAFLSPVATPPVCMTLQGGYRFLDYTKMGAILVPICLILTVVMYPIVFAAYL